MGSCSPESSDTLEVAALKVLNEGDPWVKAEYGEMAARLWLDGSIALAYDASTPQLLPVPDRPARLPTVRLVAPRDMPKLGRGGSLQSRQALVHSLVHTESWAIDLSWTRSTDIHEEWIRFVQVHKKKDVYLDIIARFGKAEAMPKEFFDDFVRVAQDEGRHFCCLAARLKELGSRYGALPAHDGLWDSAEATAHDLSARLAVEHCVHEARGLDVLPTTISRFQKGGDSPTADLLESVIYPEEITHCAAGVKWFTYLCLQRNLRADNECIAKSKEDVKSDNRSTSSDKHLATVQERDGEEIASKLPSVTIPDNLVNKGTGAATRQESNSNAQQVELPVVSKVPSGTGGTPVDIVAAFHSVVRKYFRGPLKPPFNEVARAAAGFGPEWYQPLATKVSSVT